MPLPDLPRSLTSTARPLCDQVRAEARERPGVYRFLGPRGELLYVGKSVRVRSRLLSYFRTGPTGKSAELLRVARGVEWDYVPNEFEALLREFRLIRAARPRFNVHHRRDRRFAWIKVTGEAAPRLVATRRPAPDGLGYLGPFPASRALPRTLGELATLTGVRDCPAATGIHFADQLELLGEERTPLCPRAEFGSCPAPCAGRCTEEHYMAGVRRAVAFLEGESKEPLERLETRMDEAAREREFELAARLRDRTERLKSLRDEIGSFANWLARLNFVYRIPGEEGASCYLVRGGRVQLSFVESEGGEAAPRETAERIREAVAAPEVPPARLSDGEREELFLVARWFRKRPEELERGIPVESYLLSQGRNPSPGSDGTPPPRQAAPRGASA